MIACVLNIADLAAQPEERKLFGQTTADAADCGGPWALWVCEALPTGVLPPDGRKSNHT